MKFQQLCRKMTESNEDPYLIGFDLLAESVLSEENIRKSREQILGLSKGNRNIRYSKYWDENRDPLPFWKHYGKAFKIVQDGRGVKLVTPDQEKWNLPEAGRSTIETYNRNWENIWFNSPEKRIESILNAAGTLCGWCGGPAKDGDELKLGSTTKTYCSSSCMDEAKKIYNINKYAVPAIGAAHVAGAAGLMGAHRLLGGH